MRAGSSSEVFDFFGSNKFEQRLFGTITRTLHAIEQHRPTVFSVDAALFEDVARRIVTLFSGIGRWKYLVAGAAYRLQALPAPESRMLSNVRNKGFEVHIHSPRSVNSARASRTSTSKGQQMKRRASSGSSRHTAQRNVKQKTTMIELTDIPENDFSKGVRGKHFAKFADASGVVRVKIAKQLHS
jgi:hypothetical protein